MTNQNIFSILIKAFGVYFIAAAIQQISFLGFGFNSETRLYIFFYLGLIVFYLSIAFASFKLADPIALKIAGKNTDDKIDLSIGANELKELVIFGIGLVLVLTAISSLVTDFVSAALNKVMLAKYRSSQSIMDVRSWAGLAGNIVKFFLGLYLTLGFKGLSNTVKKLKEAGNS